MSARDCVILRFEVKRGGRGSLLRGMPFMSCPSADGEEDVVASVIGDVVVWDAEGGIDAAGVDAGGGGISVGVAWNL